MIPDRMIAPAASSPATAGGTMPVASSSTMATRMTMACRAPGPIGTAWRRTSSGELDDQDIGIVEMNVERLPGALQQHGVAGLEHDRRPESCPRRRRRSASPARCTARTIRSPLSVTMPGKHALADQARARRDDHLGEA